MDRPIVHFKNWMILIAATSVTNEGKSVRKKKKGKGGILVRKGAPGSKKEKHEVDFGSRLAGKSFRG